MRDTLLHIYVWDPREALQTGWPQLITCGQLDGDLITADLQREARRAVGWWTGHAADAAQVDLLAILNAQHLRQPQRVHWMVLALNAPGNSLARLVSHVYQLPRRVPMSCFAEMPACSLHSTGFQCNESWHGFVKGSAERSEERRCTYLQVGRKQRRVPP